MATFTTVPQQHTFTPDLMYKRSENVSREVMLTQSLKIKNEPKPSAPVYSSKPITKAYQVNQNTVNLYDPMQEILSTSRRLINSYILELKFEQNTAVPVVKKKPSISASLATASTPSRGLKRSRQPNTANFGKDETYGSNIPISNTRNLFSSPVPMASSSSSNFVASVKQPMSKKPSLIKLTTTPSSMSIQKKPSLKRVLRTDLASMSELNYAVEPLASTPVKTSSGAGPLLECTPDYNEKESSYDQLACHADNILRMAVDSTLLGSSYNGSISSNYSIGGPNDSMSGVLSRKKLNSNDIFDDNDPEKSLLEIRKARWNVLSRERATKIEINAEEINKVLGEL